MNLIRNIKNLDYLLLTAMVFLLVSGWFVMYSASYQERLSSGVDYSQKQFVWMAIAVVVFFLVLVIDYHFLLNVSFIIYTIVTILLLAVIIVGDKRFGARRWISIGGFSLQPSELAKFGVVLMVTKYLVWDIDNRRTFKYIFFAGLIVLIPLLLIFKQPDLGTMLTFLPTIFAMLFAAGMRWVYIIGAGLIGAGSMPIMWQFLHEYQKKRILNFLNPELDPLGSGYSVIQSKIAVGSGGILGKGWLGGTQNQLNFIPERHTDFVFSVVGEEWGFAGSLLVVLVFFIIVAVGYNIAMKATDLSGKILATGLTTMFAVQVGINLGMTIGLLPVTGIPLPFISYGGTSLVVTMAMMGLLQNIHMRRFMF